ncbi:hypothetical protein H4CHR_02981 [Variovorax sp. PBS-H4]|uniref:phage tail assembly chaperone n=1 Tax=Variovorax sp. PBS-H4 TaxID=434008 RepID=UPI001319611E|nr:hypothetical protein [Variovorax sp. PBS-H4]VTU32284.1 hypothetical protein H4CHR_02981 [Variovorax sp. PBS-H4]
MAWQLKYGSHAKALEDRARRTGVKPAALQKRPKIRVTDAPFSEAFFTLHSARTFGAAAPNPISLQEIVAYCSLQGIDSKAEKAKYLRLIQLLDQVYLGHWAEKNPSSSTPPKGSKNNQKS